MKTLRKRLERLAGKAEPKSWPVAILEAWNYESEEALQAAFEEHCKKPEVQAAPPGRIVAVIVTEQPPREDGDE